MTPETAKIEIDEYVFTVEITSVTNQPADPNCRDSDSDFFGCREIEWQLIYAAQYNEAGKCIECGYMPWWLSKIAREKADLIESEIWKIIDNKDAKCS